MRGKKLSTQRWWGWCWNLKATVGHKICQIWSTHSQEKNTGFGGTGISWPYHIPAAGPYPALPSASLPKTLQLTLPPFSKAWKKIREHLAASFSLLSILFCPRGKDSPQKHLARPMPCHPWPWGKWWGHHLHQGHGTAWGWHHTAWLHPPVCGCKLAGWPTPSLLFSSSVRKRKSAYRKLPQETMNISSAGGCVEVSHYGLKCCLWRGQLNCAGGQLTDSSIYWHVPVKFLENGGFGGASASLPCWTGYPWQEGYLSGRWAGRRSAATALLLPSVAGLPLGATLLFGTDYCSSYSFVCRCNLHSHSRW